MVQYSYSNATQMYQGWRRAHFRCHHALKNWNKKNCSHSTLEVKVRRRTGCFGLTCISERGGCAVETDTYGMLLDRQKMKITHSKTMYRSNTSKGHFSTPVHCLTELPLAIRTPRPNTSHTLISAANPDPLQHTCVYINYTQNSDSYIKSYINTYMFLSFLFVFVLRGHALPSGWRSGRKEPLALPHAQRRTENPRSVTEKGALVVTRARAPVRARLFWSPRWMRDECGRAETGCSEKFRYVKICAEEGMDTNSLRMFLAISILFCAIIRAFWMSWWE